jgi:hypothetical protein
MIRAVLRAEIARHGSLRAFARSVPIQPSVVCRTLQGEPIGPRLAMALGYRRVVRYERIRAHAEPI